MVSFLFTFADCSVARLMYQYYTIQLPHLATLASVSEIMISLLKAHAGASVKIRDKYGYMDTQGIYKHT